VQDIHHPMQRLGAEAGVIAIDAAGRIGAAHNSENFAIAFGTSETATIKSAVHQDEWKADLPHD